ncbi:hypothetical protein M446_2266 [Methylobacterium sp. 4-46]|uniref:hypothetical protein n=1 Tax=unclassified Methylobacterium TaxID=2615210 RepID=UPI000165CAB4|nr:MULTISPECIES: hypothetical protein [Methylobacterium]ACA16726.1 hypothetical protein M446_2266 [Methylobacterium sp. 4-46]WFT82425.1 hypothetical protein QA634_11485 [Methylobacterium nodulans]
MQQSWTPGAAARGAPPPLLRPHGTETKRYAAAPAFDRAALVAASLGPLLGAGLLALIALTARAAV